MTQPLPRLESRRSELLLALAHLNDMRPGSIVGAVWRCGKPKELQSIEYLSPYNQDPITVALKPPDLLYLYLFFSLVKPPSRSLSERIC